MKMEIRGAIGTQHGRKIITGFVSAKNLAELYENGEIKIDEYSVSNPNGYQREHSNTRARKFARFIGDRDNGISPTNILIYSRDTFNPVENNGIVSIPDNAELYIVDGQHRTVGISEAFKMGELDNDEDYDIPVSLLIWESGKDQRLEEAMQFFTINTQSKRPRTDLARQFIYNKSQAENGQIGPNTILKMELKKTEYVPYAIYIAKQLDAYGPWMDLINPPNGHKDAPISQGSFSDSLYPILDYAQNAGLNMGEIINLLNNYWEAIFDLCPDSYKDWKKSILMKTSGVFSLHLFLPILIARKRNLGNVPTKGQFQQILSEMSEHFNDSFWNSENGEAGKYGTGRKSFTELKNDIIDELDGWGDKTWQKK